MPSLSKTQMIRPNIFSPQLFNRERRQNAHMLLQRNIDHAEAEVGAEALLDPKAVTNELCGFHRLHRGRGI